MNDSSQKYLERTARQRNEDREKRDNGSIERVHKSLERYN